MTNHPVLALLQEMIAIPSVNPAFARQVWNYCGHHRIARSYKKNEQAHIESFNR